MKKFLTSVGLVLALLGSTILQSQAQKVSPFVLPAYAYTPEATQTTFVDISTNPNTVMLGNELADGAGLLNYIYEATSETDATPTGKTGANTGTFNASAPLSEPCFPLGFDFKLSGKKMKYFIVSAVGGAYFSETPKRANATSMPSYSSGYNCIYFNIYAPTNNTTTSAGSATANTFKKIAGQAPAMYLIEGSEGNHVLTIQYHYSVFGGGKADDGTELRDEWKFQYKFYENGTYEFVVDQLPRESLQNNKCQKYDIVLGFLESPLSGTAATATIVEGGSAANADKQIDIMGPAYLNIPSAVTGSQHKAYYPGTDFTTFNKVGDFVNTVTGMVSGKRTITYGDDIPSGSTLRFNYPAACGQVTALTENDYEYTDPELGGLATGSTYTTKMKYKMTPVSGTTSYGPLDEYIAKGTIVAVLSASETPDYTLPTDGTLLFEGDELGEGTDGVKPTVLCNKYAKITPSAAKNTFTWSANSTSATTNEITLTVNGITAGVTRYIHLYRMAYACDGAPAYSPLCHTIVLQKPMAAPQSLEIVGLPTVNSVQLKAKAASDSKVMVVKSSTLNVKPSGVLKVGDLIPGTDAKVVALFEGEQTFTAALTPDERCYFLAFSVNTNNPDKYVYNTFDIKNENLWVRARAAYNGLPGLIDMSKEPHGTPNTAYNGFNIRDKNWETLEPTLYRDLPFGWTRELTLANNKKVEGFGLGQPGYANNLAVALYGRFTYNTTSQMDAITAPILLNKGRILVTYSMQLWVPDASGLCSPTTAAANDQFTIQYAIGNGAWQNLASWTGSTLPPADKRDVYKLEAAINNDDLVGQYVRFRFMANGAASGGNRANASTFVAITTLDVKEDKICQPPTNIRQNITQTTTTQLGLYWNDGNTAPIAATEYIVAYKRSDAAGDWASKKVNTNEILLTGLRNANTYLVKMTAVCGSNGDSYQTDTVTFSTAYTFPYEEAMAQLDTLLKVQGSNATIPYYSPFAFSNNYPAITMHDGGVSTATGSLPNTGSASLTYYKGDGSNSSVFSHGNTYNRKMNVKKADGVRTWLNAVGVSQAATQAWLITPVIYTVNLEGDEPLVVRFKARSANGPQGQCTAGSVGSAFNTTTLKVLVSNTGEFTSDNVIGTVNVGSETIDGNEYEFQLAQLTGTVQVAFYYNNPNGTTDENNTNYMTFEIFDVRFEYKNDVALCPELEGLERTYLMPNQATYEWGSSEYAAYYEVQYGPADEEDYAFTSPRLTAPVYTLTNLDEQTTYKIKVTAYCDEEGETAAPNPLEDVFTTPEGCHTPGSFKVEDVTYYGATFSSTQEQSILMEREVKIMSAADEDGFLKVFKQSDDQLVLETGLYDNMSYVAQTRAICRYGEASRDTSDWSRSVSFATPIDPANAPDTFNIQLFAEPIDGGTVTGTGQYLEDDVVTIKATPNEGYRFVKWRCAVHGETMGTNPIRSITMKASSDSKTHDSTYTAVFVKFYNIEVEASNTNHGTVTGGGTYDDGTEVTLTATAKNNYIFDQWVDANGDHVTTNATYKFTPTASGSYMAIFRQRGNTILNVMVTPDADWGSVTRSVQPDEDDQYPENTEVTLTAVPADYCRFLRWEDVNGLELGTDPSYKVTMDKSKVIKAVFSQIRFNVTLKSDPSTDYGTIKGTSGSTTTGGSFPGGSQRRLEAQPRSGYEFVKWMSGTTELGGNPVLEFILTKDTTITAYFIQKSHLDINVTVEPVAAGTVTGAGKGIVTRGNPVTLTATPAAHYAFKEWRRVNNTTVSANPYTFTPDRDYTFVAVFRALENYLIMVQTDGLGSTTGGGNYEEGSTVTLKATADNNYHFVEWQDAEGNTLETEDTYTFTAEASMTVKAVFKENTKYTVALSRLPSNAAGTTTGAGEYLSGDQVTISATPNKGYKFAEWRRPNGEQVSTDNPYTFAMPEGNVSYRAVFEAACDIRVTVEPAGAAKIKGTGSYGVGEEVTLEAEVDESYVFLEWQDATSGVRLKDQNPYTFTASTSMNIKAVFREKSFFSIDVPCIGQGDDDEDNLGSVSIPNGDEGEWMEGETITMTAEPKPYCQFIEWQDKDGNKLSDEKTYTFVLSRDTTFKAVFAHIKYTVTLISSPSKDCGTINGTSGSESDGGTFNAGTTRKLEAKPRSGYEFDKWMSGDEELSTNPKLEFVLTKDITITAYFKQKEDLTITVNLNPANAGTVTGAGTVKRGNDAILTATANDGYKFLYWERINGTQHEDNPYTLVQPQRDYTFTAKFRAKEQYTISVTTKPYATAGTVTRSGFLANGKAEEDATVTLTATPGEDHRFVEWQDAAGKQVSTEPIFSFTATANATYQAIFEEIPAVEYTINVNIEPANSGRIYNDGTYPAGRDVTLRARPNARYLFDGWYDEAGKLLGTDTLYTVQNLQADVTYTAKFTPKPKVDVAVTVRLGETVDATVGTVTGAGSYDPGSSVTLTAAPASADYLFSGWRDLDNDDELISSDNPFTFTVMEEAHYAAVFREKYTVTLNILPDENAGTVTGAGPGRQGFPRTITAEPSEGYRFLGWLNAAGNTVTTETSHTFTLEEDVTFTAKFEAENENEFNVTVRKLPNNDAGTVRGNGRYGLGEQATLTATAATNYIFVGWLKPKADNPAEYDTASKANPYYFVVDGDVALTALFRPRARYQIDVDILPNDEAGTVTGDGEVREGRQVTLEASANEGYVFVAWVLVTDNPSPRDTVSRSETFTFIASRSASYKAVFRRITANYLLVLNVTPAVGGTVTGDGTYRANTTVTITATPNTGYMFQGWRGTNGKFVSREPSYQFRMTGDLALTAVFQRKTVANISLNVTPEGAGTVTGEGEYPVNSLATVTATANRGYRFVEWQDAAGETLSTNASYEFTVTSDVAYTAVFEERPLETYTVKTGILPTGSAAGTTTGDGDYLEGTMVTVTATPNPGYTFKEWVNDRSETLSTDSIYTFEVVADITCWAMFEGASIDQAVVIILKQLPNEAAGTVTGGGQYAKGDRVTIVATPAEGYVFEAWLNANNDMVSTDPTFTFTAETSTTYTARFKEKTANEQQLKAAFNVAAGNGQLFIENLNGTVVREVTVFNTVGRRLAHFTPNSNLNLALPVEARYTVLVVRVISEQGLATYKVYLH